MNKLAILQNWMKTVIVSRGALGQKLAVAAEQFNLHMSDTVQETEILPAHTRMEIYTSGYVLRLLDCMQADHPGLYAYLGDTVFNAFAKAYILHHPPQSFTVFDLSKGFADFLARTRPPNSQNDPDEEALYALPAEIARLEFARLEALRAHGTEALKQPVLDSAVLFGMELNVTVPPCMRLLELKFPLVHFYKMLEKSERPDAPGMQQTFAGVSRRHYRIAMEELTHWQYLVLLAIQEGAKLHEAVAKVSQTGMPGDALLAELYLWLPVAQEMGFVVIEE